ncbi:MAG: nucleotidyl transferase [Alphaproteobacteria bacterium]|nr:nucleotidyl transferase [Alphaproteobacteria bacterium]
MKPTDLSGIDIAVLAGGLGTRIAGVLGDTPKVLAPVGGRPFLEVLLGKLRGAKKVVLCLGHLAPKVTEWLKANPPPVPVECVIEPEPLGTAGALRFAASHLTSDPFLVMNGDSVVETDLGGFIDDHRRSGAPGSILAVEVPDGSRFGRLEISPAGRITRFAEKDTSATGAAWINGGIYAFTPSLLARLMAAEGPSLERDFLGLLPEATLHGARRQARFIDIGTPESLAQAPAFFGGSQRDVTEA